MRLNTVEVGDIMIRDVAAVIVPAQALRSLSRLRRFDDRDGRLQLEE